MSKNQIYEISTERIDDIVILLSVMKQIGLPEIINQYLPRHGNEKGLDWEWVPSSGYRTSCRKETIGK